MSTLLSPPPEEDEENNILEEEEYTSQVTPAMLASKPSGKSAGSYHELLKEQGHTEADVPPVSSFLPGVLISPPIGELYHMGPPSPYLLENPFIQKHGKEVAEANKTRAINKEFISTSIGDLPADEPLVGPGDRALLALADSQDQTVIDTYRKMKPQGDIWKIKGEWMGYRDLLDLDEVGIPRMFKVDPDSIEIGDLVDAPLLPAELMIEGLALWGIASSGGTATIPATAAKSALKRRLGAAASTGVLAATSNAIAQAGGEGVLFGYLGDDYRVKPLDEALVEMAIAGGFGTGMGALWPSMGLDPFKAMVQTAKNTPSASSLIDGAPGKSGLAGKGKEVLKGALDPSPEGKLAQSAQVEMGWNPLLAAQLTHHTFLDKILGYSSQFDNGFKGILHGQTEGPVKWFREQFAAGELSGPALAKALNEKVHGWGSNILGVLEKQNKTILSDINYSSISARDASDQVERVIQYHSNTLQEAVSLMYQSIPGLKTAGFRVHRVKAKAEEILDELSPRDVDVELYRTDSSGARILNDAGEPIIDEVNYLALLTELHGPSTADRLIQAKDFATTWANMKTSELSYAQLRDTRDMLFNLFHNPALDRGDEATRHFAALYKEIGETLSEKDAKGLLVNLNESVPPRTVKHIGRINDLTSSRFHLMEDAFVRRALHSSKRESAEDFEQVFREFRRGDRSKSLEVFGKIEENTADIMKYVSEIPEELLPSPAAAKILVASHENLIGEGGVKAAVRDNIITQVMDDLFLYRKGPEALEELLGADMRNTLEAVGITSKDLNQWRAVARRNDNRAPIYDVLESEADQVSKVRTLFRGIEDDPTGNTVMILSRAIDEAPELGEQIYGVLMKDIYKRTVRKVSRGSKGLQDIFDGAALQKEIDALKESPIYEQVFTEQQKKGIENTINYVNILNRSSDVGAKLAGAEVAAGAVKALPDPGKFLSAVLPIVKASKLSALLTSKWFNRFLVGTGGAEEQLEQAAKVPFKPTYPQNAMRASTLHESLKGDGSEGVTPTVTEFDLFYRSVTGETSPKIAMRVIDDLIKSTPVRKGERLQVLKDLRKFHETGAPIVKDSSGASRVRTDTPSDFEVDLFMHERDTPAEPSFLQRMEAESMPDPQEPINNNYIINTGAP